MKRYKNVNFSTASMTFPLSGISLSSILIFISILLMIISAFKPSAFDGARARVADFFSPALTFVSLPFYHTAIFFHNVTSLAQLQADNLRLSQDNAKLHEWYQIAVLLDSENKSLRELLNLKLDPKYSHISARVIADAGNTYVKSLLVKAGINDGVEKGAAVLSGSGLVGRIIEVSENTSRILLATDINLRVPVVVEDTGQHAIMAGTNASNPKLIHLPKGSNISVGARLITSGYGGAYPHGLPVGSVIINDGGDMGVALFSNFDRLQIVRILQKPKDL